MHLRNALLSSASTRVIATLLPRTPAPDPIVRWHAAGAGQGEIGTCRLSQVPWDIGRKFGGMYLQIANEEGRAAA